MAKYRDDLESARLRVETLEAKLRERDAELAERDAALAARDAEIAELRAGQKRASSFFGEGQSAQGAERPKARSMLIIAAVAALVLVGVPTGFLWVRGEAASERDAAAERARLEEAKREEQEQRRALQEAEEKRKQAEARLYAVQSASEREAIERELQAERARKAADEAAPHAAPSDQGLLNINCMPPSSVIVDGRLVGTSPVMGHPVRPGAHIVVCVHADKGRKSRSATAKAGQTTTVALKL